MENKEQEDLLMELMAIEVMVKENPCKVKCGVLASLKDVIHSFIGQHCMAGATREQVAKYLERDVRTISFWKEKYDDFPEPKKDFAKNKTYNWLDIVKWKMKHRELYENNS